MTIFHLENETEGDLSVFKRRQDHWERLAGPTAANQVLRSSAALTYAWGALVVGDLPFTLDAGTYSPTLTNAANLDASTTFVAQYLRVGSVVTVAGRVDVDPTTGATSTRLGISLPIASNFGGTNNCGGTAFNQGVAGEGAAIRADATNDRAEMIWVCTSTTNQIFFYTFTYVIA